MLIIFKRTIYFLFSTVLLVPLVANGQEEVKGDSLLQNATLDSVIQYALMHQPFVQQSLLDQEIINKTIKGKLADWYPQINFSYSFQRNIDLQTSIIGGNPIKFGVDNTSNGQLSATQVIFNRDVLLANSTASEVRNQAEQVTARTKIDAVVNTTKAFYDVLATSQQVKVSQEMITRLQRSLKDAQSQYNSGLTDKTDYKRAMISLSNAKASLKSNQELLTYKIEYLKTLMGYPITGDLNIVYDTLQMEQELGLDTLQTADYTNRIEFKILTT
ncbi:MAG TPA: TolC family protein, partial [Cyclobacteriaceae bacterium]